jgi:hypothetical protein
VMMLDLYAKRSTFSNRFQMILVWYLMMFYVIRILCVQIVLFNGSHKIYASKLQTTQFLWWW